MKCFLQLVLLTVLIVGCTPQTKNQQGSEADENTESKEENKPVEAPEVSLEDYEGDRYRMIIKFINNRAVVYLSDSLIYDSQTVDGAFNIELELTKYVEAGLTDLKVDVYNGQPPYNTASPDWKIVYDIFINDELVDFVSEESKDGRIGLVHTETHDLTNIW